MFSSPNIREQSGVVCSIKILEYFSNKIKKKKTSTLIDILTLDKNKYLVFCGYLEPFLYENCEKLKSAIVIFRFI